MTNGEYLSALPVLPVLPALFKVSPHEFRHPNENWACTGMTTFHRAAEPRPVTIDGL
jgi:hypothetical protein